MIIPNICFSVVVQITCQQKSLMANNVTLTFPDLLFNTHGLRLFEAIADFAEL
jgi:hypothetical protein